MKKVLRIVLASVLVAASALAFTACGAKADPAAYALVHNHYIGRAEVAVDADGKITSLEIDECELPYSWGLITEGKIDGVAIAAADTVTIHNTDRNGNPTTATYAKSLRVGNLKLTIDPGSVEAPTSGDAYYIVGTKIPFMGYAALNGAWYWEAMSSGDYDVLKADGTAYEGFTKEVDGVALTKGQRWFKSVNGYWSGESYPLGWKGNVDKIKEFYIGKKLTNFGNWEKANTETDKAWKEGGVTTGATLTDFTDYATLVYLAYTNATK